MSFLQYHSPTEEKLTWADRPSTVKQEVEQPKRLSNRPVSATRNFPASKSGSLHKMKRQLYPDATTLSRLKPKNIALDKERLYEETLTLKMEVNYFKEENLRLRTKMQQMEKELGRRDEFLEDLKSTSKEKHFGSSLHSSHLISNLKNSIKELKNELKLKEEESQKVKRDIRTSRVSELEVELHAYIDECTRLRHHLEEVMEKFSARSPTDFNTIEQIVQKMSEEKKQMEDQYSEIAQELTTANQRVSELESFLKLSQTSEIDLKSELQKLKSKMEKQNDSQRKVSNTEESRLHNELSKTQKQLNDEREKTRKLECDLQRITQENEVLKKKPSTTRTPPLSKPSPHPPKDHSSSDYEEDRAIIAAIEKSNGVSLIEFIDRCSRVLSSAPITAKQSIKSVLASTPILPKSLFEALTAAGISTTLDEVQSVVERDMVVNDLRKMVIDTLPRGESLAPSGAGTFRVKDDVEHRVAPYFPDYKTPGEQSIDASGLQAVQPVQHVNVDKAVIVGILKALGFRLQLHRIAKNKLGSTLFGRNFNANEEITFERLDKILRGPPFNITNLEESALVARFALEPDSGAATTVCTAKDVVGKLFYVLEDWEVFSTTDESEFDKHISYLLTRSKTGFLDECQQLDMDNKGFISMKALKDVCEKLNFDFDEREFHYMELLFFSLNFQLDQVPFKKLIQAYATDDSQMDSSGDSGERRKDHPAEDSVDENERNTIVRGYLELIASELLRKSLDLKQIFRSKDGILYPDKLVAGMRALGIPDMDEREMVIFLEALQCEDLDEYGIEMPLFEDIIKGYRAPEDRDKDESLESDGGAKGINPEHSF